MELHMETEILSAETIQVIEKTKAYLQGIMEAGDELNDLTIKASRQLFLFQEIQKACVAMTATQIGIFLKEIMDWETLIQITNIFY